MKVFFFFTGERNKIKNTSKNDGSEAGMELFLEVLEKKVSHRDRWFRFVNAVKNAGMQYSVIPMIPFLCPLWKKEVDDPN